MKLKELKRLRAEYLEVHSKILYYDRLGGFVGGKGYVPQGITLEQYRQSLAEQIVNVVLRG